MLSNILWIAIILLGTGFLLYRSFWSNQGRCAGCSDTKCQTSMKTHKMKTS